jgi:hypothetical protein
MDKRDWIELERIAKNGSLNPPRGKGAKLLEKTRQAEEHPDWYNQACYCRTCMSYADA